MNLSFLDFFKTTLCWGCAVCQNKGIANWEWSIRNHQSLEHHFVAMVKQSFSASFRAILVK